MLSTKLTCVEPFVRFVDKSRLFLATIIVSHFLTESGDKTLVTHQVEITGPLAILYSCIIGRKFKENLPHEMAAMIRKAESLSRL